MTDLEQKYELVIGLEVHAQLLTLHSVYASDHLRHVPDHGAQPAPSRVSVCVSVFAAWKSIRIISWLG